MGSPCSGGGGGCRLFDKTAGRLRFGKRRRRPVVYGKAQAVGGLSRLRRSHAFKRRLARQPDRLDVGGAVVHVITAAPACTLDAMP